MLTSDGLKKCSTCREIKVAAEHFYRSKGGNGCDGYAWACKPCTKQKFAEWRISNPERYRERGARRQRESRPKAVHAERERIRQAKNPKYHAAKKAAWRLANPEKVVAANAKAWAKRRHLQIPRLKMKAAIKRDRSFVDNGEELGAPFWFALLKEFGGHCCYCPSDVKMTIEHLTPTSRDGRTAVGNLAPACWQCNWDKLARTAEEFFPDRAAEIRKRVLIYLPVPAKRPSRGKGLC